MRCTAWRRTGRPHAVFRGGGGGGMHTDWPPSCKQASERAIAKAAAAAAACTVRCALCRQAGRQPGRGDGAVRTERHAQRASGCRA